MAILSFAHLKNKQNSQSAIITEHEVAVDIPAVPAQVQSSSVKTGGVLSFAHLKNKSAVNQAAQSTPNQPGDVKKAGVIHEEKTETVAPAPTVPKFFKFPAVMPTALLAATNYCQGCGRFLPAVKAENETEKTISLNNQYGRCLREGNIDSGDSGEVWKVIPARATVARCWFNLKK
jgi:hypothetical protein